MANHVYIATSLDGFIAPEDGSLDWLEAIPNPTGSDWGWADFIAQIDAIVMGRKTFEKVLSFPDWPYELPVFVLSRTLQELPDSIRQHARVVDSTPARLIDSLRAEGHRELYIDGGQTIGGFLDADLIDTMTLTRVPVLLGAGIPLFGAGRSIRRFEHVSTEVLDDHLVKTRYRRAVE